MKGYCLLACITAHILATIVPSMYAVTYIGEPMCIALQAILRLRVFPKSL